MDEKLKTVLQKLQTEQSVWQEKNFAATGPLHLALGVVEELGELQDELLGTMSHEGITDAIGDAYVFMAGYCSKADIDIVECLDMLPDDTHRSNSWRGSFHSAFGAVSSLAHYTLKSSQGIRKFDIKDLKLTIGIILYNLKKIWEWYNPSELEKFPEAIDGIWAKVSKRDWVKNKVDGEV